MLRILVNLPKLGNACSGSPAAAAAFGGESVRRIRAQRYGADSDFEAGATVMTRRFCMPFASVQFPGVF